MKTALQRLLICVFVLAAAALLQTQPSRGALAQQQRAQQTVYILVNVTPAPVVYRQNAAPAGISARLALRGRGSDPAVDAQPASAFGNLVAQSQQAVRVQAEVTPNPNATLLVPNPTNVVINGTAGTTVTAPCIYTITSNAAAIASWTIRQGLASDFSGAFSGTDLANNSYLQAGAPQPTSTPFIVYPSNWTVMATNGYVKTYCVDLTLTIPVSVPGGAYSTTAVYTLYY